MAQEMGRTYGTNYGGWWLPDSLKLNSESIIISAGVGEDISFDLAIQSKFGSTIQLLDPTERALKHFEEIQTYYKSQPKQMTIFTGSIQKDYESHITSLSPEFSKIHMNCVGLWHETTTLKFYKQANPNYVSQTLIPNLYGSTYTHAAVKRLRNFLEEKEIDKNCIDVLKLDIEGAEIQVLESMLEDAIYPKVLCVEFDYYLKGADSTGATGSLVRKLLEAGYKEAHSVNWNIVFIYTK